jgi:microcystin-dependent protein
MSRTKISEWSSTAASNTDVGGVNIAEGCPPATINNAIREVMAQCNNWQSGASGDNQTNAGTLTSSGTLAVTGAFTLDGATGTSGQVMTSAGSGATPTWADKVDGVLAGFIQMYGAASAPTGWLLCNGAAVSRSTYATLFALIGTTYGAGDGSSTFNVPDMRDKFPVGSGSTYALNATGGSADSTLPSHTHTATVTDPGHNHTIAGGDGSTSITFANGGGAGRPSGSGSSHQTGVISTATTGITVANSTEGTSATNTNLPPYRGINFIIKT